MRADEIVPGARTILLDGLADPAATAADLRSWPEPNDSPVKIEPRQINISIRYDGDDLDDIAAMWRMTRSDAIATIGGIEFRVEFFGFAPGFAYMSGLPRALAVPRHTTPRPRVPAGSVALADTYAGIYPAASPGGWRLIGRTDEVMFDVDRNPAGPPAQRRPRTLRRMIEVIKAGPLTTIQDRGRIGWAHLGVPRAGALDAPALASANALVGNDAVRPGWKSR